MSGFYGSNIIVDFSTSMYAKQMILYSFERWKPTLILESKIIRIESLHVELLIIKFKNSFKLKVNGLSVIIKELVIQ